MIKTDTLAIEMHFINYDITGDALQFVSKNTENRNKGYTFNFKAIKPGEATIKLNLENHKKGEEGIISENYKVIVINDSGYTKVNSIDIFNNPENFTDALLILEGTSRGLGNPVNAPEVWGREFITLTNSRFIWILEDNTGALFISGIYTIEKETEVYVKGKIVVNENNDWVFLGDEAIPKYSSGTDAQTNLLNGKWILQSINGKGVVKDT